MIKFTVGGKSATRGTRRRVDEDRRDQMAQAVRGWLSAIRRPDTGEFRQWS